MTTFCKKNEKTCSRLQPAQWRCVRSWLKHDTHRMFQHWRKHVPHEIQKVERSSPRSRGGQGSQCRIGPDLGGDSRWKPVKVRHPNTWKKDETHAYLWHNFHCCLKFSTWGLNGIHLQLLFPFDIAKQARSDFLLTIGSYFFLSCKCSCLTIVYVGLFSPSQSPLKIRMYFYQIL